MFSRSCWLLHSSLIIFHGIQITLVKLGRIFFFTFDWNFQYTIFTNHLSFVSESQFIRRLTDKKMKYSTTIFILSSKLQILRLIKLPPFQAFKKKNNLCKFSTTTRIHRIFAGRKFVELKLDAKRRKIDYYSLSKFPLLPLPKSPTPEIEQQRHSNIVCRDILFLPRG